MADSRGRHEIGVLAQLGDHNKWFGPMKKQLNVHVACTHKNDNQKLPDMQSLMTLVETPIINFPFESIIIIFLV